MRGLAESRAPGAYTPRKQGNNPNADPQVVLRWTTGVDINNKMATTNNNSKFNTSMNRTNLDHNLQSANFMNTSQSIKARLSAPTRPW